MDSLKGDIIGPTITVPCTRMFSCFACGSFSMLKMTHETFYIWELVQIFQNIGTDTANIEPQDFLFFIYF